LDRIGGHPTTMLGNPRVIDAPGGRAVEFDGEHDALLVDDHPLAGAETFTWEAIFRPDGGEVEQRWFHLSEQDPATGADTGNRMLFEIRVAGDRWFLDSYNESGGEGKALMNRAALHPLGVWYHVATVYDGREVRSYVDGVQEGAAPIRLAPQGRGHASVGVRINKLYFFKGAVHLARFTRAALPPSAFLPAPPKPTPQSDPPIACDLSQYAPHPGLSASLDQNLLVVGWTGERGTDLRLRYALDHGAPIVHDLAVRPAGGRWSTLGQGLRPELRVTTGVRRMSEQQAEPLRALGVEITPELIEKNKWYAFWDAPLNVPGVREGERTPRDIGLPRKPDEIRRASAAFAASSCSVKTDGERVEATFPGLSMGIFSGSLRFTVYRGTNLIRMEAIAKTEEPSVAYKYEAGLRGFSTARLPRVVWRDTGGHPQQYRFGGPVSDASAAKSGEPRPRGGGRCRLAGDLPAAAHVLLHA
jgi:hypothetical protein